jgi:hypothetical protein
MNSYFLLVPKSPFHDFLSNRLHVLNYCIVQRTINKEHFFLGSYFYITVHKILKLVRVGLVDTDINVVSTGHFAERETENGRKANGKRQFHIFTPGSLFSHRQTLLQHNLNTYTS